MLIYALLGDTATIQQKYKHKYERMSLLYMYLMYADDIDTIPDYLLYADDWQTDLL